MNKQKRTDFEVSCPFNKNHKMPHSKLLYHISKGCQDKRIKAHLFDQCPYNILHYVRKEIMSNHLQYCRTRLREQHESRHNDSSRQEIEEAIKRQFIDKNLDQNIQTNNHENHEQGYGLPSWSIIIDYAKLKPSEIINQPYKSFLSQDDEDDQDEYNLIAMLNESSINSSKKEKDIPQNQSQSHYEYQSTSQIEIKTPQNPKLNKSAQDQLFILNESEFSNIDLKDHSYISGSNAGLNQIGLNQRESTFRNSYLDNLDNDYQVYFQQQNHQNNNRYADQKSHQRSYKDSKQYNDISYNYSKQGRYNEYNQNYDNNKYSEYRNNQSRYGFSQNQTDDKGQYQNDGIDQNVQRPLRGYKN